MSDLSFSNRNSKISSVTETCEASTQGWHFESHIRFYIMKGNNSTKFSF